MKFVWLTIALCLYATVIQCQNTLETTTQSDSTSDSATTSDESTVTTEFSVPTTTNTPDTPTTASTEAPTTASTEAPTTASTAVPTTASTAAPTTASTAAPTTASTAVPTTASTAAPNTTISTLAPTTSVASTSIAPSTTKAPQPTPPPHEKLSWNVTQDNITCIRVDMKALFTIIVGDRKEYIALTENATTEGSNCNLSNDTQSFVLSERNSYVLTMIFAKEGGKVFVNETMFQYTLPEVQNIVSTDSKLFSVKSGNSYLCNADAKIDLVNATMEVSEVHVQAFGEKGNSDFSNADECDADDKVNDAIPIAVGCILAGLIIIVLIIYLVKRRQSRQKGYQSV